MSPHRRAKTLRDLQAYGRVRAAELGIEAVEVPERVREFLSGGDGSPRRTMGSLPWRVRGVGFVVVGCGFGQAAVTGGAFLGDAVPASWGVVHS
ncbi:hypothetical protein BZB76_0341 [Actinomadura pelletieri DSM 43383]|uniref:Uncharacterized protein n=1 Tax=Actinomadura pelletieri DSM 43383 TaxID=1120940 RepID=A0A495QXQ0_9ACTN|nr:hypothetical protein BZB76_0341 [Actinomadura pelletieri DSM 43383]